MSPWWEITYFDRGKGYKKYDSTMVPFKLLPELEKLDVKRGHTFKTDQFEVEIPGSDIKIHMPSRSLWVKGKPNHVENASHIVLFTRNYRRQDNSGWREVYMGLLDDRGYGILVKYNLESGAFRIDLVEGQVPEATASMQEQPRLPRFEK